MMDILNPPAKADPNMKAVDVPLGMVYTWGQRRVVYLRVDGGAVVLNGQHKGSILLLSDPENTLHFNGINVVTAWPSMTAEFPT